MSPEFIVYNKKTTNTGNKFQLISLDTGKQACPEM